MGAAESLWRQHCLIRALLERHVFLRGKPKQLDHKHGKIMNNPCSLQTIEHWTHRSLSTPWTACIPTLCITSGWRASRSAAKVPRLRRYLSGPSNTVSTFHPLPNNVFFCSFGLERQTVVVSSSHIFGFSTNLVVLRAPQIAQKVMQIHSIDRPTFLHS